MFNIIILIIIKYKETCYILYSIQVAELKAELKKLGLPTTGQKTELISRLKEALQSTGKTCCGVVENQFHPQLQTCSFKENRVE